MTLAGRRVVLGVSGGIACYKTCTLARRLTEAGAEVQVIMTRAAAEFVGPVTFEALTGQPVITSLWESGAALSHVKLAQETDLVIVAPATANIIARAAQGLADDFLTTVLLAASVPVLIAPAMNDDMYAHPATAENVDTLAGQGWHIIGPDIGALAERSSTRPGRMAEPEVIFAVAERLLVGDSGVWSGRKVIVTAGPTREELDPVRVITNRSSGLMGFELARAAFARGADVTLVTGPSQLEPPFGVNTVSIESTDDLQKALEDLLPSTDVLIMAAAPADYRPVERSETKRPRLDGVTKIELDPTPDILIGTLGLRKQGAIVVGFALETADGLEKARAKLARKSLNLIVLNMANEDGAGFETKTNRVTIVSQNDEVELPLMTKRKVAEEILDATEELL